LQPIETVKFSDTLTVGNYSVVNIRAAVQMRGFVVTLLSGRWYDAAVTCRDPGCSDLVLRLGERYLAGADDRA
jgi:hypothetical protein